MHTKVCAYCSSTFETKVKASIYCSNECRCLGRRLPVKNCSRCGKPNPRHDQDLCSRECYDLDREERRSMCESCGKRLPSGKQKYCSQKCRVDGLRPKPTNCINCGTWFSGVKYNRKQGKFYANGGMKTCSPKCEIEWIKRNPVRKEKISAAFTGANHPNWQGGKSAINICAHRGSGWQRIAEKARDRDKRVCRVCGKTESENGRKMDVHYIKTYHDINDSKKANKLSNLISLCQLCHRKEENKIQNQQIVLPFAKIAQDNRRTKRAAVFTKV